MRLFLVFASCCIASLAWGQVETWDSLRREYRIASSEERKIDILNELASNYTKVSIDKAEEVVREAMARSEAIHYQKGMGDSYNILGVGYSIKGMYDKGLEFLFKSLSIRESEHDINGSAKVLNNLAGIFMYQGNHEKALQYAGKSLALVKGQNDKLVIANAMLAHGLIYEELRDTSKALSYMRQSFEMFKGLREKKKMGTALIEISELLHIMGMPKLALETCFRAMDLIDVQSDHTQRGLLLEVLGEIYSDLGNEKTSGYYFHQAMELADRYKSIQSQLRSRQKLSEFFEKGHQLDSALYFQKEYARVKQETYSHEMADRLAFLEKVYDTDKKDQQLELREQKIESQNRIIISISIVLLLSTITGIILYRYYRQKRNANVQLSGLNRMISERNEEITVQSEELMEANEEIRRINESLEDEVNFRTEKIRQQNEKLIEYAYFNAHKVRGPLARILGLAMLIENPLSPKETEELNKKIKESALELDEVIKTINKKLETE